jgi:hypothetical protein
VVRGVDDDENTIRHEPASAGRHEPVGAAVPAPVSGGQGVVPRPRSTGDARVDETLTRLGELGHRPVAEHVEIFDKVRGRLQDVLASIDEDGPRPPVPPRP